MLCHDYLWKEAAITLTINRRFTPVHPLSPPSTCLAQCSLWKISLSCSLLLILCEVGPPRRQPPGDSFSTRKGKVYDKEVCCVLNRPLRLPDYWPWDCWVRRTCCIPRTASHVSVRFPIRSSMSSSVWGLLCRLQMGQQFSKHHYFRWHCAVPNRKLYRYPLGQQRT